MGWRAMRADDMDAVSAISDSVHGDYTEPRAVYAERQRLYPAGCFVFERGSALSGYLIIHPWRGISPPPLGALMGSIPADADHFYLHDLALLPNARGTGAGASATQLAFDLTAAAGLRDVFLLAVGGADSFWASRGFVPVADEELAARLHAAYGPEVVYMHYRLPRD
ncbi:MAG TPA: GNAT family N-acetyltransferase [Sphingobium sp.]|uniref:GNAT family N-acetyltransferase n=1 Tax=Sphingobium sp. TaxID=1912891 RepID=UPI002ED59F08